MAESAIPWRWIGTTGGDRLRDPGGHGRRSWTWRWTTSSTRGGTALSATWRDDKFHDECGLFGIWNHPEAANVTYLGLYALQHRGQESAGIAATDGAELPHRRRRWAGWPTCSARSGCAGCPAHRAIGHVRYSTAGASNLRNAQPITANTARGPIAIAHNGNLTNADALREEMERDGAIFQSNSDTEVILHLLARAPAGPLEEQLPHALAQVHGRVLAADPHPATRCYAVRDPTASARSRSAGSATTWIVASRDLRARPHGGAAPSATSSPASSWSSTTSGLRSLRALPPAERLQCVFEYVYFARPDSMLWGRNVHTVRKALGRQLAREHPVDGRHRDPGARLRRQRGPRLSPRSRASPFEMGLIRNHYVGRTFIEPKQGDPALRREGEAQPDARDARGPARGRRRRLDRARHDQPEDRQDDPRRRRHARCTCGSRRRPIQWPCYYGIDTPTRKELIALQPHRSTRSAATWAPTRSATSRSTAC